MLSIAIRLISASTLLLTLPLSAETQVSVGSLTTNAAGEVVAEEFVVSPDLRTALSDLKLAERVEIAAFPIAPGLRLPIWLERVDLYGPEARIWVIADSGPPAEIGRSSHLQLIGGSKADPTLRIGLTVDPDSGQLTGLVSDSGGTHSITLGDSGAQRIFDSEKTGAEGLESSCASDDLPLSFDVLKRSTNNAGKGQQGINGNPTVMALIAVDTDNEFNHKKFANNTTNATNWLASLFVEMNVMYERDVALRLLQGDTTFRLDTDPAPTYDNDPWTVSGSGAGITHLNEFGNWWSANQGAVDRVLAMLLSGKSASSNSSSGIAWVDGFCETQNTGGGYSVTQVFWGNFPVINDVRVIAHELGHNFGSPHTHCYSPPIDNCWNAEGGCYAGATSCPGGGTGTLMSYCHLNGCGNNQVVLHSRTIDLINSFITSHTPGCLDLLNGPFFEDGFETGNTAGWSDTVP